MRVLENHYRAIWLNEESILTVINQSKLPHTFELATLSNTDEVCDAIKNEVLSTEQSFTNIISKLKFWIFLRTCI